ncbi:NAD(P)-binding oxidoreductase [Staphylococcus massiliensis]|uniref:NAD(P)-binding domain-containing protein n=1 Tax=Staphylococcus massiliensis S46 TaxID=1229783 RepID=K9ASU1_9STAP|nr:NAD(P)-binding oxidoreductase [Staphylococcus massiliensis]EKU45702.1 hypothetical protein C273_10882 [Staphylococcus massiliensis S46]MCG3400211.1 SDR family oxidoreductase [Staphylococcus massiliensis]PNZ96897.1 NAD(P)-dependent oxidoreductase [Staphylococcus massiliensis CCUG 55927]
MRTLVLGANGGVGRLLVDALKKQDAQFTAGVRSESQLQALKEAGIAATLVDVEKDDIETLTSKFKDYDQVVFSVGSGGSTGDDQTLIVDLDGAVKTMKASEASDIKRYVMVSTYDSRREAFDDYEPLKPYTIAKHYADTYLKQSSLNYSIVHPGALTDEDGTGEVFIKFPFEKEDQVEREVSRSNVAQVLSEIVTTGQPERQEFQVLNGDMPIKEALTKFNES